MKALVVTLRLRADRLVRPLEAAGVELNDTVHIGPFELEWQW